jgi:hypothetical protein
MMKTTFGKKAAEKGRTSEAIKRKVEKANTAII